MAEFDPPTPPPSPEQQLWARVRLQRVVFGAFAIVLVSLFAVGVSAYRRMQADSEQAKHAQGVAVADADAARNFQRITEQKLQKTSAELMETRRLLALEKCRLAMLEIRANNPERAAALLAEARELGPPAWWPIVASLSRDTVVRFESAHPTAPVIAGAVSRDRSSVAVARDTVNGVVVEVHEADGKLRLAYPPVEAVGGNPTAHLRLNTDGSAWFLSLPGRAWFGAGGTARLVPSDDINGWDPVTPLAIDTDPDLTIVYEAHGERGLVARRRIESDGWSTRIITLDPQPAAVNAVCVAGGEAIIDTPAGVYRVGDSVQQLLKHKEPPQRSALHYGPGLVYAAFATGRTVELIAISLHGDPQPRKERHDMPAERCEGLHFMVDDTLVWTGVGGRAVTMTFAGTRDWTLGEHALSFADRHPAGLVFGNRMGHLSLLHLPEFASAGVPLNLVAPEVSAEVFPYGFILSAAGPERFAVQQGRVSVFAQGTLALTGRGAARFDGQWHLPDGSVKDETGMQLGGFSDGGVLLYMQGARKLRQVGPGGTRECLLPIERIPEEVAIATAANVLAFRLADTVYFADMIADPRVVAGRRDVPPDLIAIDAQGRHVAVAYGATIVVHSLTEDRERTVISNADPGRIALLFSGSVLVSLEMGEIVFYETEGGREILRAGKDVASFMASGDNSLNISAPGRLLDLRFTP